MKIYSCFVCSKIHRITTSYSLLLISSFKFPVFLLLIASTLRAFWCFLPFYLLTPHPLLFKLKVFSLYFSLFDLAWSHSLMNHISINKSRYLPISISSDLQFPSHKKEQILISHQEYKRYPNIKSQRREH